MSNILPTMSKVVYVYCLCIISLFIVLFVDCLFICCVYCLYYSVYSVPLSGDSHYGTDAALLLSCPTSYLPLSVHWRDKIKKTELTNKNRRKQIINRQVQTVFQSKNKSLTSCIFFLATIVTLHFTPASESVAHSFGACFILQQTRFYSSLNV